VPSNKEADRTLFTLPLGM